MKAEQLRKSILQLAIQGKLVPQDPADEPASVLLERIRAEKQSLIKQGKIKKDKGDSVIFKGDDNCYYEKTGSEVKNITDEIPFDIPDSWCWTKIQNFAQLGMGQTVLTKDMLKTGTPVYSATIENKPLGYINEVHNNIKLKIGDLVIPARGNSIGYVTYISEEPATCTQTTIYEKFIDKRVSIWISYFYQAFQKTLFKYSGAAIPQITLSMLEKQYIPLPPLAEQERIVAEIEKFEPLIKEYDKLEQQATKLDGEIYDKLKKSILQYAIQGKLVPQDSNDEPAAVLLERIRAEKKAQLGKKYVESYIYKGDDNCYYEKVGKNEPVLLENLPFDIPESWCWARLENAANINPRNNIDDNLNVSFVEMKSIMDGFNNAFCYEKRKWRDVKSGFTHFKNGDVGFAKITPCFQNRKSVVFHGLENCYGAGTTELHILRAYSDTIFSAYLLYFVKSPYFIEHGKINFSGTAGQQRFGTDAVKHTFIPIPPYNEQIRICNQIEIVLDKLKDEN